MTQLNFFITLSRCKNRNKHNNSYAEKGRPIEYYMPKKRRASKWMFARGPNRLSYNPSKKAQFLTIKSILFTKLTNSINSRQNLTLKLYKTLKRFTASLLQIINQQLCTDYLKNKSALQSLILNLIVRPKNSLLKCFFAGTKL